MKSSKDRKDTVASRDLVYISFSYADNEFRNELRAVLLDDIRLHELVWDDQLLPEGENWVPIMNAHVARARIMVMLISKTYLDRSCQAWKYEIPQAIKAHKRGELTILWIPVRRVKVSETPFPEIQAALPVSTPLERLNETQRQLAYDKLRRTIRRKLALDIPGHFDTFVSHNSKDKPEVRNICQKLSSRGLQVWLDEEQLQPGVPWQNLLEDGVRKSNSVAVLVGEDGIGPWEDVEMQAALRLAVRDKRPVIPVLLPNAPAEPQLPLFLGNRTWVDLRGRLTDQGIDKVVWGITGKRPTPRGRSIT